MFNRRKVNTNDILLERLNNYHPKITIELNPKNFLDMKLICVSGIYNTSVNRQSAKLSIARSSEVPKCYELNVIIGDLHQSKKISMNFAYDVKHIKS